MALKRLFLVLLGVVMLSSSFNVSFAVQDVSSAQNSAVQQEITQEESFEIAKKFMSDYFKISDFTGYTFKNAYNPYLNYPGEVGVYCEKKSEATCMVSISNKSKTVVYTLFSSLKDMEKTDNATKTQAKKISDEYLEKLHPDKYAELKIKSITKARYGYALQYVRTINKIEFPENYISIGFLSGKLVYFDMRWYNDIKFDNAKNTIGSKRALEVLKDKADLSKCYTIDKKAKSYKLVYGNLLDPDGEIANHLVDAKTGDYIHQSTHVNPKFTEEQKQYMQDQISMTQKIQGIKTLKQAREVINAKLKLQGENPIAQNERVYYDGKSGVYFLSSGERNMQIDAKTQDLISFRRSNKNSDTPMDVDINIPPGELLDKGLKYLAQMSHEKLSKISPDHFYNYLNSAFFFETVNKIPVAERNVEVKMYLYPLQGDLMGIDSRSDSLNDSDYKFPKPEEAAVSDSEARKLFWEKNKLLECVYVRLDPNDDTAKVMYRPKKENKSYKSGQVLDLQNGKWTEVKLKVVKGF